MMIPKRETPEAILHAAALIVAACSFIPFLAGFLYPGRRLLGLEEWGAATVVFVLASFALLWTIKTEKPPTIEGKGTAKQPLFPPWPLVIYCVFTGLGFTWACAFLWFARRYAFFSLPVMALTGLIVAVCAAIGLLVARLTGGNWRRALLLSMFALGGLAMIVLRLRLLR